LFCDVSLEAVISAPDAKSIYQVPIFIEEQGLANYLLKRMAIEVPEDGLTNWKKFLKKVMEPKKEVKILLVGKYMDQYDSYMSHYEALTHAGAELNARVTYLRMEAEDIGKEDSKNLLDDADGILIPGGFGSRGTDGKMEAIRYARENAVPFLGVCLGFQLAVVEFARNALNFHDANSTEFDPHTSHPVVDLLPEQKDVTKKGATMRLGAQDVLVEKGSTAHKLYGSTTISERHRHRFEVNPHYIEMIQDKGLRFTGRSPDGKKMEIAELNGHPYFIGSQFHPEFKSRPQKPAPLHYGLVKAALERAKSKKG
jgi:CTP synthase